MTFPMTQVEGTENPGVHYFDLIVDHADDIDFFGLSSSYKLACEKKDIALLPAPFGLKAACPKETTIQIAILKQPDGKKAILKHVSFPDKVKVSFVQQICFGSPYRPLFMKSNPKVGRKILQYCFENLGGHAFRCFDLSSQATRRGQSKTSMPFEDKEDAEIDEGFNYILRTAPRSSCEMEQLRWQTKELRNKSSPIFGWPGALISQALRNLSSDGALAKKEPHWPIPLSPLFYDRAILTTLEKIWDFDQSALILLGEPGTGKSPLGRSVLMAQVRHNQARFNLDGHPCARCTPELDFLRGEPGCVLMGDFLDDTSLSILDMKLVKTFKPIRHYAVDEIHRVNHKCSKKKLTRNEKKRLAKVRTNMSEVFNAWIRKKNFALNAMNPYSHRFWAHWNQNLETMPKYITRRSTATTRKRKAMK